MQAVEGFWEGAIVVARGEAEHKYRLGEEDYLDRMSGHCTRITDVKVGDYVMCQSGAFTRVECVMSSTRNIVTWRKVESGKSPLFSMLVAAHERGELSIDMRSELCYVEPGQLITYCTEGVEVLADTANAELTKKMKDEGTEGFLEMLGKVECAEKGRKISKMPTASYRRIDTGELTLWFYDYEIAAEFAKDGFATADDEDIDYAIFNLGRRPPLSRLSPIVGSVARMPTSSLRAYSLVTEQGTYVVDGLYAKSP